MKDLEEKHKRIVDNYSKEKSKHLEKQATLMLKNDEKKEKLSKFSIEGEFFDLFQ